MRMTRQLYPLLLYLTRTVETYTDWAESGNSKKIWKIPVKKFSKRRDRLEEIVFELTDSTIEWKQHFKYLVET